MLRRPAQAGAAWTVEEAAEFAALRDFKLLRLLATDRGALAAARLLQVPLGASRHEKTPAAVPPVPPPAAGAAGGDAAPQKKRKPRKLSEARKLKLEERPRAQAHRQRRMHAKLLQVLPLVGKVMRASMASAPADATMADAAIAGAERASEEAMPPPPSRVPPSPAPPSPPPQWSPSWAAIASPRSTDGRGVRDDRAETKLRSRSPSDGSPGSAHGDLLTPRDDG